MDLSGRSVGSSYLLVRPIGQGATGTVWRGVDQKSGQPVAIKLLHESLLRQPKLVTRFVQERTILLMLRHRNVVRVRDLFSVGETLGLVMDLVSGGSLRDHLRERHTVPAGEAARLSAQVAAALAEAHDLGIVHRDLKPDNILIKMEDGRPDTRLTDFGVARILNAPSMTTPNAVVGTPHYMAPEAFHGTTASPATDVYALGVVLYELVSGRPPYDSDEIADLMRLHMAGDPERRPGIPDPLWDVIMACMALKPRLRPSAAELVADLSDLARDLARVPALPRPERSAPRPALSDDLLLPGPDGARPGNQRAGWPSFHPEDRPNARRDDRPEGRPDGRRDDRLDGRRDGRPHGRDDRNAGPGGGEPHDEAPSLIPLPRAAVHEVKRRNQPPGRRWARPGATLALVAGAMAASVAATIAWNDHRAEGRTGNPAQREVVAAPSGQAVRKVVVTAAPSRTTADAGAPKGGAATSPAAARKTATPPPPRPPAASLRTRSPQPEAKPYGPWQCSRLIAFDLGSRTPLVPQPCHMIGRDIQLRASLTARGGAVGSITVALQDAGSGRTVGGPKTCSGLSFDGDAPTRTCGPVTARPARGHQYAVVMSYRYVRDGRTMVSSAKGERFTW